MSKKIRGRYSHPSDGLLGLRYNGMQGFSRHFQKQTTHHKDKNTHFTGAATLYIMEI